MLSFLRKRTYLVTAAVGAAGATALYLYGRKSLESLIKVAYGTVEPRSEAAKGSRDKAIDLESTMDSHFSFIQGMSTPQEELERLLPQLQALLYQLTDVQQLRPTQQQQPQPASARLRSLARLCFTRTLAACWLIPLMELLIRVKLNIVGRHLFLQEKLGALSLPLSAINGRAHAQGADLPAELSPESIESFMSCDSFSESGVEWVVMKVMEGVDSVLDRTSLESEVSTHELLLTIASMVSEVDSRMAAIDVSTLSSTSDTAHWAELLCSSHEDSAIATQVQQAAVAGADAYRQAVSWAAAVQELQAELRGVLSSPQFAAAIRSSVELTFRAAAIHVLSAVPKPTSPRPSPNPKPGPSCATDVSQGPINEGGPVGGPIPQGAESHPKSAAASSGNAGSKEATPKLGGTGDAEGCYPEAALAGEQKIVQPNVRPMARLLKPVQSASDPLFSRAKDLVREITELVAVKGLCASIFAAPLGN